MKVLIFQHHLLCRAAAGGLSMERTGRSGWSSGGIESSVQLFSCYHFLPTRFPFSHYPDVGAEKSVLRRQVKKRRIFA